MKDSWRLFELILSGIQICCGLLMLTAVYLTFKDYYLILWTNPLIDHHAIIEMAVRKNLTLLLMSFLPILSAVLLIKNVARGWVMSVITWIMFIIILIINAYRINKIYPQELGSGSKFIIGLMTTVFIAITIALNNPEFMQKYKPTRHTWIAIAVSIICLTATKFI